MRNDHHLAHLVQIQGGETKFRTMFGDHQQIVTGGGTM